MTSETRTLIELTDIAGIEFECRKCGAKVLYPLAKHHDRLADICPNCYEPWFLNPANQHPSSPTTADGVKRVIVGLHNLAKSELVSAQVRLLVNGLPKTPAGNSN